MEQLPEKWCIKPKNENQLELIYNYGANEYGEGKDCAYYYHYPEFKPQCFARDYITKGYKKITFEQFKKLVLKQNNMKNKSIKINIPEGMEIDKEKSTFEEIVFKNKEKKLPKTWEELRYIRGYYINSDSKVSLVNLHVNNINKNVFPTKELAEAALALAQLLQLRDIYNDGWTPDWCDTRTIKNVIIVYKNQIQTDGFLGQQAIFAFKDMEVRDEFYNNFISLLQIAKPLL